MTRILRLLLIAAVAWPLCHPAAAQEVVQNQIPKKILQKERVDSRLLPAFKGAQQQSAQQIEESVVVEDTSLVEQKDASTTKGPKANVDQDITVAEGTTTNQNVPINLYYLDWANECQIIYPANTLNIPVGTKIKAITFYSEGNLNSTYGSSDNTVTLKLGKTGNSTFSTTSFISGLTTVATLTSTQIFNGTKSITFTFSDDPYVYNGDNLVVDVSCPRLSGGKYASANWYGITNNGSSIHGYSSSSISSITPSQRNFLPKMTMKVEMGSSEETYALDFETVNVGNSKQLTAFVANELNEPVTATVTATAPFSVASNTVTLNPSEDGTTPIAVTFTPTAPASYNGTLTVVAGDKTKTIRLTGIGNQTGVPCTRDSLFFAGIEYKWPISTEANTSTLDEIATDPDQIIAMLRKVYMDPTIPGNLKRGYTTSGGSESNGDVSYAGVGSISRSNSGSYSYNNSLGWSIPNKTSLQSKTTSSSNSALSGYTVTYMNPSDYKPDTEGVTLLLLEMVDGYDLSTFEFPSGSSSTSYDDLRSVISTTIKSARVVTQARRTGDRDDFSSGTLFKIDCEKMNKFFLLAKGQLRWLHDSYYAEDANEEYVFTSTVSPEPCYLYYDYDSYYRYYFNGWHDGDGGYPFSHMFEQFSPVVVETGANIDDLYQSMISDDMTTFGVYHDCITVPFAITSNDMENEHGHQFMMYGVDSEAVDCQDVQDMMFFVPDYRMMKWDNRDFIADYQKFDNYNTDHQPTLGLYVIRQKPITANALTDDYCILQLNWKTNLDEFLPSDEQEFELLQIVTDEYGNESYVPVYYMNANGEYTDAQGNVVGEANKVPIVLTMEASIDKFYPSVYVEREDASKEVTYAIRGRDKGHFLSLQYSNRQSYIIPGLDPNEMIRITQATNYSRFNPQTVKNCYSNKILLNNNALGINNNTIVDGENGTKLNVIRSHVENVNGENTTVNETIATITFSNHASADNRQITVTMANQSPKSEYPNGKTSGSGAGYHANSGDTECNGNWSWSQSYKVTSTGNISLDPTLIIYDNFAVKVANNDHPSNYTYRVETNYDEKSVFLNVPSEYAASNALWYAYTWSTGTDSEWIEGTLLEKDANNNRKYQFNYNPSKTNVIFVRMNPYGSNIPSFDDGTKWNQTENWSFVEGRTYTITGWGLDVSYEDVTNPDNATAYSNIFRIPVFKTGSKISSFTETQVLDDVDGLMLLPNTVDFEVDVQRGSKTELLRYDAYRWKNTAATQRFIIDNVNSGDDEDDLPPTGIAGNQGETYSVSMNVVGTSDYITSTATLGANGWGVAKFEDMIPPKNTEAAIYDYAPVVEVLASGYDLNRTDYNTYGGPLQSTASAKAVISVVQPNNDHPLMSTYTWTQKVNNVDKKYAYYNINISVDTKDVPAGYDIYMIRAWREIDENLLGEEYEELEDRISGDVLFEEIKYPDYDKNDDYVLGSGIDNVTVVGADNGTHTYTGYTGTFGAQKLRTDELASDNSVIDELDATFTVRIYFTKNENLPQTQSDLNGAPLLRDEPTAATGDGKFYIVEAVVDKTFKANEVVTSVISLDNARQVVSEKYYNPAGIESDTPFKGVNIVVTRYSDGSTTTTKILK